MLVLKTNWPSSVTVTLFTFSITHFGIAPWVANSKVLGKGMWTTYSRLLCCSAQQRFKLVNSLLPFQHNSLFSQDNRVNVRPTESLTITVWPWGDPQLNQLEITTDNYTSTQRDYHLSMKRSNVREVTWGKPVTENHLLLISRLGLRHSSIDCYRLCITCFRDFAA